MKKTFYFLAAFLMVTSLQAQFIQNADFEAWTGNDPNNWSSANQFTSGFMIYTCTPETANPHNGTKSLKLTSLSVLGNNVPGLLTNGTLGFNMTATPPITITGGIAFTERPQSFKGWYTYAPVNTDNCMMIALLKKKNVVTNQSDTVGYATFIGATAVSSWTEFTVDFTYNNSETPDTLQIVLLSSNPAATVVNSTLLIDDLYLEGGTIGIMPLMGEPEVKIFAVNKQINIETALNSQIEIFDLSGKRIFNSQSQNKVEVFNASQFENQVVLVSVNSNGKKYSKKVVVE